MKKIEIHAFLHFIREKKFKNVAEIGVFGGNLAKRVVSDRIAKIDNYYCVDPWVPYIEEYDRVPGKNESKPEWWENIAQKVYKIQEDFPVIKIIRKRSVEGALYLKSNEIFLDSVYIDAVHDGMRS